MSGSNPTRDAPEELRKVYNPANKNTIHKPRNLQQEAPHTAAESKANWGANRKFQSSVEMKSSAPNSGVSSTLAARGSGSTCHEHLDQERPFRSLSDNLTGSTGRPGSMNTNREGPGSNPMTPEASMGHAGMQRAVEVADHYTIALANVCPIFYL